MVSDHVDEGIKQALDWLSFSAVVTSIMGIIPELAAILPLIWYSIRIYETKTVQGIVSKYFRGEPDDIEP